MRLRRALRAAVLGTFFLLATATAYAQSPTPDAGPQPGICAPWHRCLAIGLVGIVVLAAAAFAAGYMVQKKGFDSLEHRQGTPGGVRVDK